MLTNRTLNKEYISSKINELFDLSFNFTYNNTNNEELKSMMIRTKSQFVYDDKVSFIQDFFNCGILEILDTICSHQEFVDKTVKDLAFILIFVCSLTPESFWAYIRKSEGSVA